MVSGLEAEWLRRRRKFANGSDADVVDEQLRITGRDVEAHTAHARLSGLHVGIRIVRILIVRILIVRIRIVRIRIVRIRIVRIVERVRIRERIARPQTESQAHARVERVVRAKEVHWSDKPVAMHEGSALDEIAAVHEAATYERSVPAMDERLDMRAAKSAGADYWARTHSSYASSVAHHRYSTAVEPTAAAVEPTAAAVEPTAAAAVSAASALREGRRRAAEQQGCTAYRHQHS